MKFPNANFGAFKTFGAFFRVKSNFKRSDIAVLIISFTRKKMQK